MANAYMFAQLVAATQHPAPGSQVRWCSVCSGDVWVSPASLVVVETNDAVVVCMACAPGVLAAEGDPAFTMAPGQVAEMRAAGMTDRDIARTMHDAKLSLRPKCDECGGSGVMGGAGSYYDQPGRGKPCGKCKGTGRV